MSDVKKLYNALLSHGYTSDDLGDENTFSSAMGDANNRKELYDGAKANGLDLGDYDEYEKRLTQPQGYTLDEMKAASIRDYDRERHSAAPEPSKAEGMKATTATPMSEQYSVTPKPSKSQEKFGLDSGIPSIAETAKGMIERHRVTPAFSIENQPQEITAFGEGVKQGKEQLVAGAQYGIGEAAASVLGTSRDDIEALAEIERLQAEGKDVAEETKNVTDLSAVSPIVKKGLELMGAGKAIGEAEKITQRNRTIQKALKENEGDVDKAKEWLESRAGKQTWADEMMADATYKMAQAKPTKGWGWVGSMIPQMVGTGVGLAASMVFKSPLPAQILGGANMAGLTLSTAGSAMAEARQAGASNSQVWASGIANGAVELLTEKIPYNRYVGRISKAAKDSVSQTLGKAVSEVGSPANKELKDLLSKANKQLGGKLFSGKNVEDYMGDLMAEGLSEATAEGLQTILPILYENPENYPTFMEILGNSLEGAKGGVFMGMFLGGASKAAEHRMNRARRKAQGYVDVAEVTTPDGKDEIVEVVRNEQDQPVFLWNGEQIPISENNVKQRQQFNFEDFERGQFQLEEDEAYENGKTLETPAEMTDANNMYEIKAAEIRERFGLGEDADEEAINAIFNGDALQAAMELRENDTELSDLILEYAYATATRDGIIDAARDRISEESAQAEAIIDYRKNKDDGMIHAATLKAKDANGNDRQVYVVSGNIVTFEDGTINTQESSNDIIIQDAVTGKPEFATAKDLLRAEQALDPEVGKQNVRNTIADTIATEVENKMNNVLPFNVGDAYNVIGADGAEHSVQVMADNGDGSVMASIDNAEAVAMPKSEIQQLSNEYNINRARLANEAQKEAKQSEKMKQEPQNVEPTQEPVAEVAQPRIPTNEQGEPMYEQAPVVDTWAELVALNEGNEEEAIDTANIMLQNAQKTLDDANKIPAAKGNTVAEIQAAKAKRKALIDEAQAMVDYWSNVVGYRDSQPQQVVAETAPIVEEQVSAVEESTPIANEQTIVEANVQPTMEEQGEQPESNENENVQAVEQSIDDIPEVSGRAEEVKEKTISAPTQEADISDEDIAALWIKSRDELWKPNDELGQMLHEKLYEAHPEAHQPEDRKKVVRHLIEAVEKHKDHPIAKEVLKYVKYPTDEQILFRNVYHGSGAEFDKFDHSYMGTGEGHQAIGWGTYVTEVEGIGKQYARMTSKPRLSFKGDFVNTEGYYNPWRIVSDLFNDHHGKLRNMRAAAERYSSLVEEDNPELKALWEDVKQVLSMVRSGDLKTSPARYLYSVEIPDDNGYNYIYWDREVSEDAIKDLQKKLNLPDTYFVSNYPMTGERVYKALSELLGGDKVASKALNNSGYVGISYPADGGNAGDARNYVIFNEADLDIYDSVRFRPTGENNKGLTDSKTSESGQPILDNKDASLTNFDANIKRNSERTKRLDDISRYIKENGEMGAHELLHEITNAVMLENNMSTTKSRYADLGNGITLRIGDHYANASNFAKKKNFKKNYGVVIKLEKQTFIPHKKVDYVEYVYFPDKLNRGRQIEVVEGLKKFIQTNDFSVMPTPDKEHSSGQFKKDSDILFRSAEPAPVFYSNAEYAVKAVKQEKATPEQWLKMIEKNGGLKAGEDKWLGLSDWLKSSDKKTLTKQEVLDFIKENQIQIEEVEYVENPQGFEDLKREYDGWLRDEGYDYAWEQLTDRYGDDAEIAFADLGGELQIDNAEAAATLLGDERSINPTRLDYTTEGLENNKEIALVVPTIESWNESDDIHFGDAGDGRAIAWVRFGETTDADGNRVLVIDEVQSKRHQAGRDEGYRDEAAYRKAKEELDSKSQELFERRKALIKILEEKYGSSLYNYLKSVEIAPRVTRLVPNEEVMTREEVREYNETSQDAILQQEADLKKKYLDGIPSAPFEKNWAELAMKRMLRYAAENGFDKIAWTTGGQQAERYSLGAVMQGLTAYKTSPNTYYVIPYNNGAIGEFVKEYDEKELAETFGKEIAINIITNAENATEENPYEMTGDDLRIGASGMKAFYDQMIPSFMNKYGKKWGVKVQDVTLPHLAKSSSVMHSIDVTDAMRESVMQGQPMFRLSNKEQTKLAGWYDNIAERYNVSGNIQVAPSREVFEQTLRDNGVAEDKLAEYDKAAYIPEKDMYLINGDSIKDNIEAERAIFHEVWHKLRKDIITLPELEWLAKSIGSNRLQALNDAFWNGKYETDEAIVDELISVSIEPYIEATVDVDGKPVSAFEAYLDNHITLNEATDAAKANMTEAANEFSDVFDKIFFETKRTLIAYKNQYYGKAQNRVPKRGEQKRTQPSTKQVLEDRPVQTAGVRGDAGIKATRATRAEQRQKAIISTATDLASSLGVKMTIIEDLNEINDSNPKMRKSKRGSKAWYNITTDEVVFVAPNATSVFDAMQSVWHEVVAHKGLRDVVGREKFDAFLMKVFNAADTNTRSKIVALAAKNGWDFKLATEEYMADLAEEGFDKRENRDFWQKVRDFFMDMLREAKIAIGFNITDNDMRYMLWRTYQMQKKQGAMMAAAENVLMQQKLGVGNFRTRPAGTSEKTMFRTTKSADIEDGEVKGVREAFDKKVRSAWYQTKEAMYDNRQALKEYMRLATKAHGANLPNDDMKHIEAWENPYMAIMQKSSINQKEVESWEKKYYHPILNAIYKIFDVAKKRDVGALRGIFGTDSMDDILNNYLQGKHGLERNRDMAVRNALDEMTKATLITKKEAEEMLEQVNTELQNDIITPTEADARRQQIGNMLSTKKFTKEHVQAQAEVWKQRKDAIRKDDSMTWAEKQRALDKIAITEFGVDLAAKDYSGLGEVFPNEDGKLEQSIEDAYTAVEAFEELFDTKDLWDAIKAANNATIEKSFRSGIINKATMDSIRDMYDYYIPLRGFEAATTEDVYGYLNNEPRAFSMPVKRANGRASKAEFAIPHILQMAHSAILQGNNNLVKMKMANFAQHYPTDLIKQSNMYIEYNETDKVWETPKYNIPKNATPEEANALIEAKNESLAELAKTNPNKVRKVSGKMDVPYIVQKDNLSKHQIPYKRNGVDYILTVNGDPRLASVMNGELEKAATTFAGKVGEAVEGLTRYLSSMYTQYNPEFMLSNAFRDGTWVLATVPVRENAKYTAKFYKNYFKLIVPGVMQNLFVRYEKGTLDMSKETHREFANFMQNGGETGYAILKDVENTKKRVSKDIHPSLWSKTMKLIDKLGIVARGVESSARFAAYLASREEGRSITRSAYDAKEVSVNFNRKGAGATFNNLPTQTLIGQIAGATAGTFKLTHTFFNAGMQGLAGVAKLVYYNPFKATTAFSSAFLLGMVVASLFDDDDDYYNLSETARRQNIIIRAGEDYVSIPLAIELRAMYGLGEMMVSMARGKEDVTNHNVAYKMADQILQAFPINVLEGNGGIDALLPTAAALIKEVWVNEDWQGMPIYREDKYPTDEFNPEWQMVNNYTGRGYIAASKFWSELWGGNEGKRGELNILGYNVAEINPAKVQHIAEGILGGPLSFFDKTVATIDIARGKKDFEWRNIPFASRIMKDGGGKAQERANNREYYNNEKRYDAMHNSEKKYEKIANDTNRSEEDREKYRLLLDELKGSPEYEQLNAFHEASLKIDKMYRDAKKDNTLDDAMPDINKKKEEANAILEK